ncbi:MAG TPA: hypothetical protein VEC11_12835 [Allosphingosinicella sp.]|nr:hypothetical protein [Allosphingosinicella sp.]
MSDWSAGRTTRRVVAGGLFIGWLVALVLPALTINIGRVPDPPVLAGWEILRAGALSIAAFQFGWLANPLLLLVLAMLAWGPPWRSALRVSAGLLVLCTLDTLDLFLRPDYYTFEGAHAGYYVWVVVNLVAAVATFVLTSSRPKVAEDTNTSKATIP